METVSRTARYMALFRALETARPRDRLFDDPFARYFLPPALRVACAMARVDSIGRALDRYIDARWPGARSSGIARTRFIDDWIAAALAAGARQLVILGAGFDCRRLRLPALADTPVFEVDRPALLADKKRRLEAAGVPVSPAGQVPVDFLRDDVAARLSTAGMHRGMPTLFLWEGVTNYLDESGVAAIFDMVARTAAPRSRIIFTYVHADVLDGHFDAPGLDALFARLTASGERWTFGFRPDELGAYLGARGLRLIDDLGAEDYRRMTMGSRAAGLVGYEFYRLAIAEVTAAVTCATSR